MAGKSLNDYMLDYYTSIVDGTGPTLSGTQNVSLTNGLPSVQLVTSVTDSASVTSPGAGAAIATTASLPAGTYNIDVFTFIGGTTVSSLEITNMRLVVGGVAISRIVNPVPGTTGASSPGRITARVVLNSAGTAQVIAVAAGTSGSVYAANIVATRMA